MNNDIVKFNDAKLAGYIKNQLDIGLDDKITVSDMEKIKMLMPLNIDDLSGLEHAKNIEELIIGGNITIKNISVLSQLRKLTRLTIIGINNVDSIIGLDNLYSLYIYNRNLVLEDIDFIDCMENLRELSIECYAIKDISKIRNLKKLKSICIAANIRDYTPIGELKDLLELSIDVESHKNLNKIMLPTPEENKTKVSYNKWIDIVRNELDREEELAILSLVDKPSKNKAFEVMKVSPRLLTFTYGYFSEEELIKLFTNIFQDESLGEEYIRKFLVYKPFNYTGIGLDEFEFIIEFASNDVRIKAKKIKLMLELA